MGHILKNHATTIISQSSPTKTYLCGDTWKFIQCLCLIEGLDNKLSTQMMERFATFWYDGAFLWISHDRLLSKPWFFKFHTCFDNSVSFVHLWCRFCFY